MIEVAKCQDGFQNICRSPFGEELSDGDFHCNRQSAWQSAMALIDLFYACYTLKQFIRDAYEEGMLNFEEWQQLSLSLDEQLP